MILGECSSAPALINNKEECAPVASSSSTTSSNTSNSPVTNRSNKIGIEISYEVLMSLQVGDIVQCTTKEEQLTGELLQINAKTGILLMCEQRFGSGKSNLHFINVFNLKLFKKLPSRTNRSLNLPFVTREQAEEQLARAEYRKNKLWIDNELINEQGVRTFVELKRMFDDVIWDGANIIVLKCVQICHPYDESAAEPIDSRTSSMNTLLRIRKILGRRISQSPTAASSSSLSEKLVDNSMAELAISSNTED